MKLLAAALLSLAAGSAAAQSPPVQGVPGIEPVYAVITGRAGITVRVASNGCTRKSDMTIAISKGQPRPVVLIARKHPDNCRSFAAGRAEIAYGWDELGLKAGQAFSLANPLTADPTPEAASARSSALCQKFEAVAVAEPGRGAVRLLGPEGPLDVENPPLVAPGEVTGAEPGAETGENLVRVSVAPAAVQRLSAWTLAHRGSSIAVLLDGRVARIVGAGAVSGQGLQLGGFDRAQAVSVAAAIAACGG